MVDMERLKSAIEDSGLPMVTLAERSGILRTTIYNRLNGIGEFTASEIVALQKALRLTNKQRDDIFFAKSVN